MLELWGLQVNEDRPRTLKLKKSRLICKEWNHYASRPKVRSRKSGIWNTSTISCFWSTNLLTVRPIRLDSYFGKKKIIHCLTIDSFRKSIRSIVYKNRKIGNDGCPAQSAVLQEYQDGTATTVDGREMGRARGTLRICGASDREGIGNRNCHRDAVDAVLHNRANYTISRYEYSKEENYIISSQINAPLYYNKTWFNENPAVLYCALADVIKYKTRWNRVLAIRKEWKDITVRVYIMKYEAPVWN